MRCSGKKLKKENQAIINIKPVNGVCKMVDLYIVEEVRL